jgi:hypothetical protein
MDKFKIVFDNMKNMIYRPRYFGLHGSVCLQSAQ